MKIGILTFANVANFGANLQALSSLAFFEKAGYQATIINWLPKDFKSLFMKTQNRQAQEHFRFFREAIAHTRECATDEDIAKVIKEENIEAVVIGSDAVLQHFPFLTRFHFPTKTVFRIDKITSDRIYPNAFWGSFYPLIDKRIPLILMSGSCQNIPYKNIMPWEKKKMAESIRHFSYFSVRDSWTQKMIKYITNNRFTPPITADPVFAFNQNIVQKNVTSDYIVRKFVLSEKYILFSFKKKENINKDWLCEIEKLFNEHGYECVALPMPDGVTFEHPFKKEIRIPLSPLDWYNIIRFSAGYIGENMHPIVVCLHNAVPCFSFDAYGRKILKFFVNEKSSKVYDILEEFELSENYKRIKSSVSPKFVVDRILNFDKTNCKKHSERKIENYNMMMNNILNVINHEKEKAISINAVYSFSS